MVPQQPATVVLARSLARSAYEERHEDVFWTTYLPQGRELPASSMGYTSGGWINTVPRLCRVSPLVQQIVRALCLTTAGQADDRVFERQNGLKCYTSALRDLSAALTNSKTATNTAALSVTSRLCGLYEVRTSAPLIQAEDWGI